LWRQMTPSSQFVERVRDSWPCSVQVNAVILVVTNPLSFDDYDVLWSMIQDCIPLTVTFPRFRTRVGMIEHPMADERRVVIFYYLLSISRMWTSRAVGMRPRASVLKKPKR
jgi:hypothetical protein